RPDARSLAARHPCRYRRRLDRRQLLRRDDADRSAPPRPSVHRRPGVGRSGQRQHDLRRDRAERRGHAQSRRAVDAGLLPAGTRRTDDVSDGEARGSPSLMMTQRSKHAAVVAALLFTAAAARAGTYPVYGPRNFVRDISQPAVVTEAFTVAAPQRPYLLRIVNGGANGALEKVTSAIIKVNGQEIAGTNDFNAKTPPALDKPVTLSATNELSVELRGNPGSGLTLSVLGEDNDPPVIVATVTPPPNEAGWNRETVTVTFTCSDALTSVTQCTPPITVSAEGAAQILAGTATDSAGNTATRNVTINLDKTPPSGAIVSPHNGAVVRNATLDLTGNASASLS